jgi:UDP-N-acetyl-2-amino-2-deoxyglucuronate dehydrogenase
MPNQKIKFAILGLGHIGKRHAEMIKRNEEAELVSLIEIDETKHDELKKLFGEVPIFKSVEEFNSSGIKCDVINIATPNGIHASQALNAIESGHHVVIEKPMGLSKMECENVIYTALHHSKHVFCVMQNRYSPPSEWLKKIVTDGTIGDIYMVQVNCYWNRDDRYYKKASLHTSANPTLQQGAWHGTKELDGGTLFTQFSHFIDLMYWVFGDIEDIQAKFSDFNHADLTDFEDSGFVNFRFTNGGMGALNYSTSVWDKNLESSMTIIGKNGTIKVGGQYMDKVEYCHIKDYEMPELKPTNPPNDYGQYKGSAANHHYIIENVVDVLKGRSRITTNALEGLKVVDIIERIYALKKGIKG